MAAPVAIAHTHVHSLRLAAGAEALVARVLAGDGTAGYGFTLNQEAMVARDMAAWDALARSKRVSLFTLLGGSYRRTVRMERDEYPAISPDWAELRKGVMESRWKLLRIDPFAWGSVEMVQTIAAAAAAFDLGVALLAPNAHPWEIQYCAALAATIKSDDTKIIVRGSSSVSFVPVPEVPGVGIDWTREAAFAGIRWQNPSK